MKYIISYKVALSFNIGIDLDEENVIRYTESVIDALISGHALFEEVYEYPIDSTAIITEHAPNNDRFFTYLDFKLDGDLLPNPDNAEQLEQIREWLTEALQNGRFELVILWRRNLEAHIVFELKNAHSMTFN